MTSPVKLIKNPYEALEYTAKVLRRLQHYPTWIIPQSGGKDSRAVAWSVLILLKEQQVPPPKRLVTYFSDTLMEYPSFLKQAEMALDEFVTFARQSLGLEAHSFTTRPKPEHDFWVCILGKGQIPPTGNMRWCTDKMKIIPPRDVLKKQGWDGPRLIGVRYGESARRDKMLASAAEAESDPEVIMLQEPKILSCAVGGECGPDVIMQHDKRVPKEQPIVEWAQCAVWDFITLVAPGYGFDPSGLIEHYGPDGNLRYGCWSCPLIWNDKTGRYLAAHNPPLGELVKFTDEHFRSGGSAWKTNNRELFEGKDGLVDGRLSLEYCQRIYDWMLNFELRHGIILLESWQKDMIRGIWAYRRNLPEIMRGQEGQMVLPMPVEMPEPIPSHISQIENKTASVLARVRLIDDNYHRLIACSAKILVEQHPGITWLYSGSSSATFWYSYGHTPHLRATYTSGRGIRVEPE